MGRFFQLTYLGSALRKLGVELEVYRAGKYKSAFETFASDKPSPETSEVFGSLDSSELSYLVTKYKQRRPQAADVAGWFKTGFFSSDAALKAGIVDAVGDYQAARDIAAQKAQSEEKKDQTAHFADWSEVASSLQSKPQNLGKESIGLIHATGEINLASEGSGLSKESISPGLLEPEVEWALGEDEVKAVVLRIDSPGGSATASEMIWAQFKKLASKKPLIVSMGQVAASGGYYIASPAQLILAEPLTLTGSIGVIGAKPVFKGVSEQFGISFFTFNSSLRRAALDPATPASEEDKRVIGEQIDATYETFLSRVAEGRRKTRDEVHAIAQGRVYNGLQAKELGLVDQIGGLSEALLEAKKLAGLDVNKLYPVSQYEGENLGLTQCLQRVGSLFDCLRKMQGVKLLAALKNQLRGAGPTNLFLSKGFDYLEKRSKTPEIWLRLPWLLDR